jgi:hypothetical protein
VLADNYLLLYAGWEGVGLASYLLIGFWQQKPTAAAAAKKAFIVNRVGDVGLSIAVMLMFAFGTLLLHRRVRRRPGAKTGTLTAIGLLLLLGACGKSAQFPLQSWLGDAMEGPTPVGPDPRGDDGDRRRVPDRAVQRHLRRAPNARLVGHRSSARSRCCSARSSVARRTTSRRRWPDRRCRRSAT